MGAGRCGRTGLRLFVPLSMCPAPSPLGWAWVRVWRGGVALDEADGGGGLLGAVEVWRCVAWPRRSPPCTSSTALSRTSYTRWCSPLTHVLPMYMPGRMRTASRPLRTCASEQSSRGVSPGRERV